MSGFWEAQVKVGAGRPATLRWDDGEWTLTGVDDEASKRYLDLFTTVVEEHLAEHGASFRPAVKLMVFPAAARQVFSSVTKTATNLDAGGGLPEGAVS